MSKEAQELVRFIDVRRGPGNSGAQGLKSSKSLRTAFVFAAGGSHGPVTAAERVGLRRRFAGKSAWQNPAHCRDLSAGNDSFDNLYGGWEGVNGLAHADLVDTSIQITQRSGQCQCLLCPQNDFSLTSPPLSADCLDGTTGSCIWQPLHQCRCSRSTFTFRLRRGRAQSPPMGMNALPPGPDNLPGGCTRDLVHRFYQEQFQLDHGRQDRYVTGK